MTNGCRTCGCDFTSVHLFDAHKIGTHGPGGYRGALADWTAEQGRRCLTPEEMAGKGWEQDGRGRWFDPDRVRSAREAFALDPPRTLQNAA